MLLDILETPDIAGMFLDNLNLQTLCELSTVCKVSSQGKTVVVDGCRVKVRRYRGVEYVIVDIRPGKEKIKAVPKQ